MPETPQFADDDSAFEAVEARLRDAGARFRASSALTLEDPPSHRVRPSTRPTLIRTFGTVDSRRQDQRRRAHRQRVFTVAGATAAVLAIVGVMVLVSSLRGTARTGPAPAASGPVPTTSAPRMPAPGQVVDDATHVPVAAYDAVGAGTVISSPFKISGDPLTVDGKPQVFYYGAEYCPYCAAERWGVVTALSRFGTWTNLQSTTSASQDVFPGTPTFSFYRAKYTSQYIAFDAVEIETNQRSGDGYQKLETPSVAQNALVTKYDTQGSIPFIDFGNKFMISGATYDPQVLQGKSIDEIAASLKDPSTDISKSVLGAANQMTAAICEMTDGKPGTVCDAPAIRTLRSQLDATN